MSLTRSSRRLRKSPDEEDEAEVVNDNGNGYESDNENSQDAPSNAHLDTSFGEKCKCFRATMFLIHACAFFSHVSTSKEADPRRERVPGAFGPRTVGRPRGPPRRRARPRYLLVGIATRYGVEWEAARGLLQHGHQQIWDQRRESKPS